tara:strand:- start:2470 stop:3273 length:804 start_codon:yes stop_codon:yes gene_type:complete
MSVGFIKGATGRSTKKTAMLAKEFAEKRKKDLAAAMKRVKKAGENVRAVEAKGAVKAKAKKQKRVVGDNTRGMKKVNELSPMDQLELAFDKLTKSTQRAIINKARKGIKTKYNDMLEIRKGIEREGKTAEAKARREAAPKEFKKRQEFEAAVEKVRQMKLTPEAKQKKIIALYEEAGREVPSYVRNPKAMGGKIKKKNRGVGAKTLRKTSTKKSKRKNFEPFSSAREMSKIAEDVFMKTINKNIGGKVNNKPRGVGVATRGFGKAMK